MCKDSFGKMINKIPNTIDKGFCKTLPQKFCKILKNAFTPESFEINS